MQNTLKRLNLRADVLTKALSVSSWESALKLLQIVAIKTRSFQSPKWGFCIPLCIMDIQLSLWPMVSNTWRCFNCSSMWMWLTPIYFHVALFLALLSISMDFQPISFGLLLDFTLSFPWSSFGFSVSYFVRSCPWLSVRRHFHVYRFLDFAVINALAHPC